MMRVMLTLIVVAAFNPTERIKERRSSAFIREDNVANDISMSW